jgi:hypothetical protein
VTGTNSAGSPPEEVPPVIRVDGLICCTVEKAAYGCSRVGPSAADPLERLVESVRLGEDVRGGLSIRVLVGSPKARYPQRCRISKRTTEIGGRGPLACGSGKRFDYFGGIVAEKPVGQNNVRRCHVYILGTRKGCMPGKTRAGILTSIWVQFSPWLFNVQGRPDAYQREKTAKMNPERMTSKA